MDQTLLENRARKWIDMGKPWFGGLASGRELRDFRRAGVPHTASQGVMLPERQQPRVVDVLK